MDIFLQMENTQNMAHILERGVPPLQIQNPVGNTAVKTNLYSSLSFNVFPID